MPRIINFKDKKREKQYMDWYVYLNAYKLERGCVDCGWNKHPAALVLDHRDPATKTVQVSCMYSYSWGRQQAELALCDVRCANCHQIRTYELGHMGRPDTRKMVEDMLTDGLEQMAASVRAMPYG